MSKRMLIVLGSVTPPGRMHRTVNEAAQRATDAGLATVEVLDLAGGRTGFVGAPPVDGDETAGVIDRLRGADAVLFASPVYRGSFTGVMKNLLDVVPVGALEGKPAGIMAMGNTRDHAGIGASLGGGARSLPCDSWRAHPVTGAGALA